MSKYSLRKAIKNKGLVPMTSLVYESESLAKIEKVKNDKYPDYDIYCNNKKIA